MQPSYRRLLSLCAIVVLALLLLLGGGGQPASAQSFIPGYWFAEFFNGIELAGTPIMTRWDTFIDYRWYGGSPDPRVPADNFSVRWTRNIPFNGGHYRFSATMDDGMRVWLDNVLIIDSWTLSEEHTVSVDSFVPSGNHIIRVEYFEKGGQSTAIFNWRPITAENAGPQFPNWRGIYFNTPNLTGAPVLIRDDRYLNQNWGVGSPGPGVNTDSWSARWNRVIVPQPGNYTINMTSDDGSRLFINDVLIIDNWLDQQSTASANYFADGTPLDVRVEFYDNFGPASLQVDLIPIGGTAPITSPGTCATAPTGLQAQVSSGNVLNVRRAPTTLSEALTQLQPCQIVALSGFRSADSQWVQVVLDSGQTGWVFAQFVRTGAPVETLSVAP